MSGGPSPARPVAIAVPSADRTISVIAASASGRTFHYAARQRPRRMADNAGMSLFAISDLHVAYEENRRIVEGLRPESDADWLIVAGDVAERVADVEWALRVLSERFATVVWAPGNHELWTPNRDPVRLRGERRYAHLVEVCRSLGVLTPEDEYPTWPGED